MSEDFWIDTMRKTTGRLDQCEHGRYGYEACEACATEKATAEIERLCILVAKREDLCGQLVAKNELMREALSLIAEDCYNDGGPTEMARIAASALSRT